MKAIFKQEWKASKRRVLYTSAALAAVMLGAALVNFAAYKLNSDRVTFFGSFLCWVGTFFFCAVPFYAVFRGSGNLRSALFGETGCLMMLAPFHSAETLFAKQTVNTAECLIYAVPSFFYLTLMLPTQNFRHEYFSAKTYFEGMSEFYNFIFVADNNWTGVIQIIVMYAVLFFVFQTTLNLSYVIYSLLAGSAKKPRKFFILLILILLFYVPARLGLLGFDGVSLRSVSQVYLYWSYLARFCAFGAVYFIAASWLLEHKVEV